MSRFRYKAASASGSVQSGTIDAIDPIAARAKLRDDGMLPLSVKAAGAVSFEGLTQQIGRRSSRASVAEVATFTRQMATLITSGVQIEEALAAIARESHGALAEMSQSLRKTILDGGTFRAALQDYPDSFDRFFLTSVSAGEQAGRLGPVLEYLAAHIENRQRNRQSVTLALIYPVILILVSVAVVVALLAFVLPDIVKVFAARGAELPGLTRVMIAVSDLLTTQALPILMVVGISVAGLTFLARKPAFGQRRDLFLWRSGLARQVTIVQFTGTLATLIQSGVALSDALSAAIATVQNRAARDILSQVARDVHDGASLSLSLGRHKGFPPMMITMIASGEASGRLPAMLGRFAEDQQQSLQARVKTLVGLVEPLVLLVMGGVIMLLVLAILMPIVNLNSLIR